MSQPLPLTDEIFSAFLNCKYKAYLKLTGAAEEPSDYAALQRRLTAAYREAARARWLSKRSNEGAIGGPAFIPEAIAAGHPIIADAVVTDSGESCRLDGLERAPACKPQGGTEYRPVLFVRSERPSANDRLLLAYGAGILGRIQGAPTTAATIIHGSQFRSSRVELRQLLEPARRIAEETRPLREGTAVPPLVLNRHCQECEFRRRCRAAAVEKDDLSLLTNLKPKEIAAHHGKGIFTVTQFSYTFRPGRMRRVVEAGGRRHDPALQALAIRQRAVYVTQRQPVADAKARIFLDVEGLTDPDRYYLVGLIVDEGKTSRRFSFWADRADDEAAMWASFLDVVRGASDDFVVYHYGSYDARFIRRMAKAHGGDPELLARIKERSVNVLTVIHGRIFFPCYGNDLKSVAGYLGFRWSTPEPSGLQAIAWRHNWEATREEALKQQLIAYNQEDCSALRRVVEVIRSIGGNGPTGGGAEGPRVVGVEEIKTPRGHKYCDPDFVLPEFNRISKCAYFDYQRDRVLVRTSPAVKRATRRKARRSRPACKVNEVVEHSAPARCPQCGAEDSGARGRHSRTVVDLKPGNGGLRRWVTQHKAARRFCRRCGCTWMSDGFPAAGAIKRGRPQKFGRTLCAWVGYVTVVLRQTNEATAEALDDFFGVSVRSGAVSYLRAQAADRYRETYASLLAALRGGRLVHVDETWAKLKYADKRGYVWVFANPETAVYVYSPTREGDVLRETLTGFKGVLVSDFYAAYDALDCPQQKCLVHLIRDINDDLVKRPFDQELKQQAVRFAHLMQAVVETIDQHGLKQCHLHKHRQDVDRFYDLESGAAYASEAARHYRQRFLKYRDKLFTFLDHDGVPWNNNNAENAVKRFVSRRRVLGGTGAFSESCGAQQE